MKKVLVILLMVVSTFAADNKKKQKPTAVQPKAVEQKQEAKPEVKTEPAPPKMKDSTALEIRNKQIDQAEVIMKIQQLTIQQLQSQIQIMQAQQQSQNLGAEIATLGQQAPSKQGEDVDKWDVDLRTLEYKKREIKGQPQNAAR